MNINWESAPFEECIEQVRYTKKVQRQDFQEIGNFPIVSQEEEFINGYWDKEEDVFKIKEPVVIFGDHTKIFKFIDFDFVLGADGVKILQTKSFLEPKFFYYQLLSKELRALGYARHFKLLKEWKITFPDLPEQRRIVAILDEAFEGIAVAKANAERNLQNARVLFESYLESVFTERGDGWEEKPLESLTHLITKGSSPNWQGISYVEEPGILFITSENVGESKIILDKPKYVEEKFNLKERKSILKKGDVLTNIVGASIGRTCVFELDKISNINQAVCLIRCKEEILDNFYLCFVLNSPLFKKILHQNEVNSARANLSLGFFSNLRIPFPKIKRQKELVSEIKAFQFETRRLESIYRQKIAALDELKKSLLHEAFSGRL